MARTPRWHPDAEHATCPRRCRPSGARRPQRVSPLDGLGPSRARCLRQSSARTDPGRRRGAPGVAAQSSAYRPHLQTSGSRRRQAVSAPPNGLALAVLAALGEVRSRFGYLDVVALAAGQDSLPCLIPLGPLTFNLVKRRSRCARACASVSGSLRSFGKANSCPPGRLFPRCSCPRPERGTLSPCPALCAAGLGEVAAGRFLLPVGSHDAPSCAVLRPMPTRGSPFHS